MSVFARLAALLLACTAVPAFALETLEVLSRQTVPGGFSNGSTGTTCGPHSSGDGRWWVYCSAATDVIPGLVDVNASADVFLLDRQTGETRLVSHAVGEPLRAAAATRFPGVDARIARDGSAVYFVHAGGMLTAGPAGDPAVRQLYRYDVATGTVALVTRAAGTAQPSALGIAPAPFDSGDPVFLPSDDGSRVVFRSASPDLVAGSSFAAGAVQIFAFDVASGSTLLASRAENAPTTGAGGRQFDYPGGRYLAYLADDTTVVRFDLETAATRVVARPQAFGNPSTRIALDGSRVLFTSTRPDLVAGVTDTNQGTDLFAWTAADDSVRLVSHAAGEPLRAGNGTVEYEWLIVWLRRDGGVAYYATRATDHTAGVVDANLQSDFLRVDFTTGVTALVTRTPQAATTLAQRPRWSDVAEDGASMLFTTDAALVPGIPGATGGRYTYRWQAADGSHSAPALVLQGRAELVDATRCFGARFVTLTHLRLRCRLTFGNLREDDGLFVVDATSGHYFPVPDPAAAVQPTGMQPGGHDSVSMSADGSRALYNGERNAQLVAGLGPEAVRIDTHINAALPGERAGAEFMTRDGRRVMVGSAGIGGYKNLYWYDIDAQAVHAITTFTDEDDCLCSFVAASHDGRRILFSSFGNALAGGLNPGGFPQLYVHDTTSGLTTMITRRSARFGGGAMRYRMSQSSVQLRARMSRDGGRVFFETADLGVADRDSNTHVQILDHDVAAGTTRLVSHFHAQPNAPLSAASKLYDVDATGRRVLFYTGAIEGVLATDVAWPEAAGALYLHDTQGSARILLSHRENNVALPFKTFAMSDWFSSMGAWLSGDGRRVLLDNGPRTMAAARYDDSGRAAMMYDVATRRWQFVGLAAGGAFPDQPLSFRGWSLDGNIVLFTSKAGNLAQEPPTSDPALYRYLHRGGRMSLVSHHASAENLAAGGGVSDNTIELSDDGRIAVFGAAALLQEDVNNAVDLYRATYAKFAGEVFCDGMEGS